VAEEMNKKQKRAEDKKKRLKVTSVKNIHSPNKHLNYNIARMVERRNKDESYTKHRKNTMKRLRWKYPELIK